MGMVTLHCCSKFISMDAKRRKTGKPKAKEEAEQIMHAELNKMIKEGKKKWQKQAERRKRKEVAEASQSSELRTVAKPGPNTVAPAIGERVLFKSSFGGGAEVYRVAYVPEEAAEIFDTEIPQGGRVRGLVQHFEGRAQTATRANGGGGIDCLTDGL